SGHDGELAVADTGPDDMAFWMYSSGSTGRPKGIVHLHHDMAYTVASYAHHILNVQASDRLFSIPKLYFAYGFGNGITFPFAAGACAVLMAGQPRAEAVFDTIEKFRPTVLFGLPTLYTALCRSTKAKQRDLSSLRMCLSAAETLSEDVFSAWRALTGIEAIEGLGSTEMLHIYLSNNESDKRLGSAGFVVPGYEVKLVDPDGVEVSSGIEGAMMVRGDSSAPCYWNRCDKTADTMREDWIYTGDLFIERDGAFYFQGRADDLIKVSGQWVWPLEVERCLAEHPYIHECAVLAHQLIDKRMTLRAVVKLRRGHEANEKMTKTLQDFVKRQLIPFKYPRVVEFVDVMPHTGTGKIDRQALLKTK
ncbi:MAG: benzoate-CoA ligase family protein, partial [Granulosicoccus sp.]